MSNLKVTTLSKQDGSASVPVATVINGSAKAWVNFNGTGTVAIRAAFNVSSITDNGVGNYTVNFTDPMPDANYAVTAAQGNSSTNLTISSNLGSMTTANFNIIETQTDANIDHAIITVAVFR